MNHVNDQMIMYYVYVLQSEKTGQLYVGSTKDLRKRFSQHNLGQSTWTKRAIPWKLIYYEACLVKEDAQARERYFKSGPGRQALTKRLKRFLLLT
jgi:putative endonuclease